MIFWITVAVVAGLFVWVNWGSWDETITPLSFFCAGLLLLVLTLALSAYTGRLDMDTRKVSNPPTEQMIGIPTEERVCGPNDDKAILISGMTIDATFWVPWGAPREYKRVEVCE